ncbi:hypothetical protein AVEN_253846-1 [Araneus ventricosus]|uniref:Uncharacterized protein n=1 Tax=Araneus ventricosus TaxID=182803 RepID=A0A4Y2LF84_ARAVE|nr:hypothetical protein AVEN_253846-1 [Araneus ventricosus]
MYLAGNSYQNPLGVARIRPLHLKGSLCDSSSDETGVLISTTCHGLTSPVVSTHYHRQRVSPNHYCIHQGSETPFTYPPASHPRTRGTCQWYYLAGKVNFK